MPVCQIVLTEHQARFVERLVASGRYHNADEVLREGLRLVERREQEDEARLAALRLAIGIGIADIDAGFLHAFDSAPELAQHLATVASGVLGE
ncbi:type II toxin-antitoxin system ParD family antitoxin [Accumulibacter sp.]|uniref:type II toxin-antitoxin system ParD family antitoxin n=1 Tax=Accumulibacter sp. TaxID=2053492 RepID=UPI0025E7F86F|nr:type II toxin-antitoxin system ParD family antitoxin [Accumulibacter sp.]MCM8596346.1 type II toxin-antitoxin system ParD family antitoxin [Accumulibacter sp.]MCM8627480.1 type II toxin-antitoxin system ParD family antitoxin [Accumulibacter sp.]MDS4050495.1 type II toxin-antitoxin system ParD family antitoxin [Accumulibacter sp.]